ncbi:MAG: type II toxin-antitoxin system RelE/ParE family toxin [Pseudomonadota bacterium]
MSAAVFIVYRTRKFDREAKRIWREKDIDRLVEDLSQNPEKGVHLGGGLYKLRIASHGRGTRGGSRIIYLLITAAQRVFLLTAYAKNEKEDLTKDEYKTLRAFAEQLRSKGEHNG